jgi:hypothetical protein
VPREEIRPLFRAAAKGSAFGKGSLITKSAARKSLKGCDRIAAAHFLLLNAASPEDRRTALVPPPK